MANQSYAYRLKDSRGFVTSFLFATKSAAKESAKTYPTNVRVVKVKRTTASYKKPLRY